MVFGLSWLTASPAAELTSAIPELLRVDLRPSRLP